MTVYGIPNCNSVKKAIDWLNKAAIPFNFHNYKKQGITAAKLNSWSKQVGWEKLLNKKGTTWRQLSAEQQAAVTNQKTAVQTMQENPSIIKRPVIEYEGKLVVGYDEALYEQELKQP